MRVKISELEGAALDYAVAVVTREIIRYRDDMGYVVLGGISLGPKKIGVSGVLGYSPRANWSQGGPLIDKYDVSVVKMGGHWYAYMPDGMAAQVFATGDHYFDVGANNADGIAGSALVAAMRAIVAARTDGDTVDVPDELVEGE